MSLLLEHYVRFKKLVPEAVTPTQATIGSAAYDLTATSVTYDSRSQVITASFGIALEMPAYVCAYLMARSSVSKRGLVLANGVGLIDSDYRGELMAKFYAVTDEFHPYHAGDVCAQILFVLKPRIELLEVDLLTDTARGSGGFGSTDAVSLRTETGFGSTDRKRNEVEIGSTDATRLEVPRA